MVTLILLLLAVAELFPAPRLSQSEEPVVRFSRDKTILTINALGWTGTGVLTRGAYLTTWRHPIYSDKYGCYWAQGKAVVGYLFEKDQALERYNNAASGK